MLAVTALIKNEPEEVAFEEEYSSGTKCGNIFRTEDRKYTLICEFCEDNFDDMIQFGAHLEVKHFRNDFEHLKNQQIKVEINDCPSMEKADTSQETYQEIKVEVEECSYDEASVNQDESLPESENLVDAGASLDKADTIASGSEDPRFDDKNALCTTCDRRFSSKCSCRKHVRKHKKLPVKENEKIFCDLCNSIFKVPHLFRAHAISKHGNTIPKALQGDPTYLACFRCNQPFETPLERHEHEKMHKPEDPYVCPQCPKTYSDKRYRRSHIRTHDSIPRYSCPHCKVAFRKPHSLKAHVRLHQDLTPFSRESGSHSIINNDKKVDTRNDEFANQIEKEIDGCRPHKEVHPSQKTHEEIKVEVDDCDPIEEVNGSQETDEDINLEIDEYSYGEISVKQNESLTASDNDDVTSSDKAKTLPANSNDPRFDEKNLYCVSCDRHYSSMNAFKGHVYRHRRKEITEDFKIICEFCNIAFKVPRMFRAHVVSQHGNSIPKVLQGDPTYLACGRCHKTFETPLERHEHEQAHKAEDPYHCRQCSKTFPNQANRRFHMLANHDSRPLLSCPQCSRTFRFARNLEAHVQLHLGLRPFPCEICGKRFKTKSEKTGHRLIHKEKSLKCEECGQLFRTKSNLRQHLHHHSDVRYKCEHCEKECESIRKLKNHLVKHSNERPYECAECKATFKYPASLKKHMSIHARQK